jgi:hypothetical protein
MPGQSLLDMGPSEQDAAIGWKSPTTGKVNVSYSLTMPNIEGQDTNGIEYWLLQGATELGHGILAKGETSGMVTASNISVASGDMVYLRVGNNGASGYDDTRFTMTVTSVPEPGTLIMIAIGMSALLAYVWRKR